MARKQLSPLEARVYNNGERLIPGVTNDKAELVRHRNSYLFFKQVIENDVAHRNVSVPLSIIDLGCGVGHGCETLSDIPNAHVVGVDSSAESIEIAKTRYARNNISYQVANLQDYVPAMPQYDYVVSRNVFEHLSEGLELALATNWRHRLLLDVPYDEPPGRNPHHVVHNIREESFARFPGAELLFQDLDGIIYNSRRKPSEPNIIICVCSRPGILKVDELPISYPFLPWHPLLYLQLRYLRRHKVTQRLRRLVKKQLGI